MRWDGGHETEGYFVIAANSRYYGGRFGPTPLAHMQDGLLDFCVLKEKSFTEMIRFWISALRKEQLDEPLAEYFRADLGRDELPLGRAGAGADRRRDSRRAAGEDLG